MIKPTAKENKTIYITRHTGNIEKAKLDKINAKTRMAFFKPRQDRTPVEPAELFICHGSLEKAVKFLVTDYERTCDQLLECLKYYRKLLAHGRTKEAFKLGHFNYRGIVCPPIEEQV